MWPVSRRETILHFAQYSAETSPNHRAHRQSQNPSPHDLREEPDAALTAPGQLGYSQFAA